MQRVATQKIMKPIVIKIIIKKIKDLELRHYKEVKELNCKYFIKAFTPVGTLGFFTKTKPNNNYVNDICKKNIIDKVKKEKLNYNIKKLENIIIIGKHNKILEKKIKK